MKALVSLILAVVLVGGIYLATTSGCGARAQVAGDNLLKKIDGWLGELDVKRKKIENNINTLEGRVESFRQRKISTEVRLEEIQKKVAPLKTRSNRIKQALAVINPHLGASEDVEINGNMKTPAEIKSMADQLLGEYESTSEKLGGLEVSMKAYQQSYDLMNRQFVAGEKQMKDLKSKLTQIDAKKEALDEMRTAQKIVGENGSISDEFNKLESEIDDLFIDVETGMRVETERLTQREMDLDSSQSAIDDVLEGIDSVGETKSKIDEILGSGNDH